MDDFSIPLYTPTSEAGPRHTQREKKQRKPYEQRYHGPGWRMPGTPENYPCPTDAFYHQYDTDTLELTRLLATWLTKGELKRPIYDSAMRRACAMLKVWKWLDPLDKKLKWRVRKDWQKRLIACGIDPVSFQIKDINRWSRAWEYMKCQYRCPVEQIEQDILNGVPAPEYRPFTWSQSLKTVTGKRYNEYGPKPKKGNELVARSWVEQINGKVGRSSAETIEERKARYRNAGRPNVAQKPIPLTEENPFH